MVNVPFLTPRPYVPPTITQTPQASSFSVVIGDLINYLDNVNEIPKRISPRLKELKKKIDDIYKQLKYKIRMVKSSLKGFSKLYSTDGEGGGNDRSFFQGIYQNITSVFRNNRRTIVKSVLRCNKEKEGNSGGVIQPATFHSNIETNLSGTD